MAQILHTQIIHKLTQVGMVIATRTRIIKGRQSIVGTIVAR